MEKNFPSGILNLSELQSLITEKAGLKSGPACCFGQEWLLIKAILAYRNDELLSIYVDLCEISLTWNANWFHIGNI